MRIKKLLAVVVGLALALTLTTGVAAADSIDAGTVNLQMVIQQHPEAMDYQAELQEEMMELQQEFEEETAGLDPEEDAEEMQQIQQDFEEQVMAVEEGAEDGLMDVLQPDVDDFMAEEGYDMIVAEGAIVGSEADVNQEDVTDEFIEFINGEAPQMEMELDEDDLDDEGL